MLGFQMESLLLVSEGCLLCISTSEQVLRTPFDGQNQFFDLFCSVSDGICCFSVKESTQQVLLASKKIQFWKLCFKRIVKGLKFLMCLGLEYPAMEWFLVITVLSSQNFAFSGTLGFKGFCSQSCLQRGYLQSIAIGNNFSLSFSTLFLGVVVWIPT